MSSKRKSPPSKLPEGAELSDKMSETVAATIMTSLADAKENNDSSLEDRNSRGSSPNSKRTHEDATSFAYKMSPPSETSSVLASGSSECEDFFSNDEEGGSSPTLKRQRQYMPMPPADIKIENGYPYPYDAASQLFSTPPLSSLLALQSDFNYDRMMANSATVMNHYGSSTRHKKLSNAESAIEKSFNLHLNNNNTLHNNNEHAVGTNGRSDGSASCNANSNKKSMDDVVKKLTSKMNDNSISKEERRSRSPPSKRR